MPKRKQKLVDEIEDEDIYKGIRELRKKGGKTEQLKIFRIAEIDRSDDRTNEITSCPPINTDKPKSKNLENIEI